MKKYSFHRGRNRNRNHPLRSLYYNLHYKIYCFRDTYSPYFAQRQEKKFRDHDLRTGGS